MGHELEKAAISSLFFRKGKLLKARVGATPLRLSTLLAKLGVSSEPTTTSGTPGAGSVASPSSRGLGGVGKLTPPPPVGGMQMQRNLFAKTQQPGQFQGFTTKKMQNPAGISQKDLGLPPVTGLPKVGQVQPITAPAPVQTPPPVAPEATSSAPAATPNFIPPPPPAVASPALPGPESGFVETPGSGPMWTPPSDWKAPRPWADSSGWEKTKTVGGQALEGLTSPFGTGLAGSAGLMGASLIPGMQVPAAVATLASMAWNPIKGAIDREYGGTDVGQIRKDMPQTTGEAQAATGIESKEQFLEQYGDRLDQAMADPVLRGLGVQLGVFPGGFSLSNDIDRGEWVPREAGGGEWSGEGDAWQRAMVEKAMQNPEKYPELAASLAQQKQAALLERNRAVLQGILQKTASPLVAALRAAQKMQGQEKKAAIACRSDREAVAAILKNAGIDIRQLEKRAQMGLGSKLLLGLGASAYGLGSAITPSEQTVPGVGGLGRFGLGLAGLYGGYKLSDKIGLPGWLGALLGMGVLPGLVGGLTGATQGGGAGNLMGNMGNLAQNPLVGGALGYMLADKVPQIGNVLPGGKWGGAALGALTIPGLMGGLLGGRQQPSYGQS
jgi:hypothetical protein